jgi:multimeric flavodoxin WrbA
VKVIVFNGSPHADGALSRGLLALAGELEQAGVAVETVHAGNKQIRGCVDCRKCRELGRCVFDGDLVNESLDKLASADGLVLASPVYYGGIAGGFKCFLDRLFFTRPDLRFKVGAAAVSLRRSGGNSTFHQLTNYLNLSQVIITPSVYWNVFHGNSAEEASEDDEGMQIMQVTGRNMAWLLHAAAAGKQNTALPLQDDRIWTNFIR